MKNTPFFAKASKGEGGAGGTNLAHPQSSILATNHRLFAYFTNLKIFLVHLGSSRFKWIKLFLYVNMYASK